VVAAVAVTVARVNSAPDSPKRRPKRGFRQPRVGAAFITPVESV
jgi:hypothetical protein